MDSAEGISEGVAVIALSGREVGTQASQEVFLQGRHWARRQRPALWVQKIIRALTEFPP